MPITREIQSVSASRRDAARHHRLLLALERATDEIRRMETEGHPDIDEVLNRLLPDLAAALNAEQAFVAVLREDAGRGKKWLELTAVYPRKNLLGHCLEWSGLLQQLIEDGKPLVIDPLGEEPRDPIAELEIFDATSAVLVQTQVADQVRIVGICNKADPDVGPYLAADRMALDSIVELVAMGARVGERRRRELQSIQRTSAAISAELDLDELLPMIAKRAAEVFGAPATSLMLWDKAEENLVIMASEGLSGEYVQQQRIPKERIYAAVASVGVFRPLITPDLRLDPFGQLDLIESERLCSVLSTLLLVSGELIGVLNIYSKDTPREFSSHEIELAGIFANQAAIAIENARLRRREMEGLLATSDAIKATLDLDVLLPLIASKVSEAFSAPATSLMLWDEAEENLVIMASEGLSDGYVLQQCIPKERAYAAATSNGGFRPLVTSDLRLEPSGQPDLHEEEHICTVLSTPLLVSDKLIGVLNIYSKDEPREFTPGEIELSTIFANQAAIAIEIAQLHHQTKQRGEQLVALDQIALDIAKRLETKELLRAIVERATELVQGAGGGVYLFIEADEAFRSEAMYGLPSELEGVRIEKDKGVIGQVFRTKQPVAVADYQRWSGRLRILDEHKLTAVVAAPIVSGDHLLGAITVHDTREERVFGEAEKELLLRFGNHVAVALDNARSYADLREARDYQERLIGTSLDGIIAVDKEGWVIVFNDGAEQILGYKRNEVLDRKKRLDELYWNPQEPRGVNLLLYDQERLKNYEMAVKNKNGERIPIMLSATLLRDGRGHPIGSVGFFKDLRPIKKAETDLKLSLDTTRTVVSAQSLDEGLMTLAEKMVTGLSITFCYIMLGDDSGQKMVVKVAYPIPRPQSSGLKWKPGLGKEVSLSETPFLKQLLEMPEPQIFRRGDVLAKDILSHFCETAGLEGPLESALIIPLQARGKVFGMCTLGEMRSWERSPFTPEKIDLAYSMASLAALLIDRMRAHEVTERKLAEVKRLREIGEDLVRAVTDRPKEILDKVAQAACEVVGAGCAVIYPWDKEEKSYDVSNIAHFGLRQKKSFSDKTQDEEGSMTGIVLNREVIFDDVGKGQDRTGQIDIWRKPGGFMELEGVEAFVGIALRVGEEPLGALFVNFREPHYFTNDELETITLFANQAAMAVQQSKLFQQVSEEAIQLRLSLLEVGSSISELRNLEDTLRAVAHGIQQVLGCDVVTVYSYDEEGDLFPHPAVVAGDLRDPQKMQGYGPLQRSKIFSLLLEKPEPHFADDALRDEIMGAGRFVKRENIRSSAGIRLSVGGRPIGLLFVNFRKRHQFSEDEKNAVWIFANQAAIAIQNARSYEELKRTKGLVGARTALAWMGMASSTWRHAMEGHALTVREQAQLLRRDLQRSLLGEDYAKIDKRLDMIERLTTKILDKPLTPPLAADEGVTPVVVNELIGERAKQLWQNEPYRNAELHLNLHLDKAASVRTSPEWLRRAFDVLVDNAVEAVVGCETREITIGTREVSGGAEIIVRDTGPGMPQEVLLKLFREPIERPEDAKGLGMGLLMAQTIVQTYGGEIMVESTGPKGTTMVIWLPLGQ